MNISLLYGQVEAQCRWWRTRRAEHCMAQNGAKDKLTGCFSLIPLSAARAHTKACRRCISYMQISTFAKLLDEYCTSSHFLPLNTYLLSDLQNFLPGCHFNHIPSSEPWSAVQKMDSKVSRLSLAAVTKRPTGPPTEIWLVLLFIFLSAGIWRVTRALTASKFNTQRAKKYALAWPG